MRRQLLREIGGTIDPIETFHFGRNPKLREGPHRELQLLRGHRLQISELLVQFLSLDRKFIVVGNHFPQKQRQETNRQLAQELECATAS